MYVKIHIFKSIIIILEFIVVEIYILFDKIQIVSLIFNGTFSIVMKFQFIYFNTGTLTLTDDLLTFPYCLICVPQFSYQFSSTQCVLFLVWPQK